MMRREYELMCEQRGDKLRAYYASHPEAREWRRQHLAARKAAGTMVVYRKYDAAKRSACIRLYLAGEEPSHIMARLGVKRSSFWRFCRGIALRRPWRRCQV